jgi:hypothetical protein
VPPDRSPDYSLFFEILRTLEAIDAPYMIIGAFVAALYGSTRVTYDIDIVVDLREEHIQRLAAAFPSPRYYADPMQMRESIRMGIIFNIIDSSRGEKADLIPLTMAAAYRSAFLHRVRQQVHIPGVEPLEVWIARPEDIIVGKLTAWAEGRSRKHETDIYEMLVFNRLQAKDRLGAPLDEAYIETQARALGAEVTELWQSIRRAAQRAE